MCGLGYRRYLGGSQANRRTKKTERKRECGEQRTFPIEGELFSSKSRSHQCRKKMVAEEGERREVTLRGRAHAHT